jgi:hypothetical protein
VYESVHFSYTSGDKKPRRVYTFVGYVIGARETKIRHDYGRNDAYFVLAERHFIQYRCSVVVDLPFLLSGN